MLDPDLSIKAKNVSFLLLNSEEYSVVDPDPKNPYVLKKNTVLWIRNTGLKQKNTTCT
jgi:hypothetical protein